MTADALRRWCLACAGASEEFPFGGQPSVFKVGGKMFALSALESRPLRVSLKCEPELGEGRAGHPVGAIGSGSRRGYHRPMPISKPEGGA
jgi:predicted DNA-binding protein (MmcQ/YjbR family)